MTDRDRHALLTVAEVADILRISTMSVYRMVGRGAFPAVKVGRVIRIPRAGFDAWLAANTTTRGSDDDERTD